MVLNNRKPEYLTTQGRHQSLRILKFRVELGFPLVQLDSVEELLIELRMILARFGLSCNENLAVFWDYEVPECTRVSVMGDSAQIVS
jgi:hypothetical protein